MLPRHTKHLFGSHSRTVVGRWEGSLVTRALHRGSRGHSSRHAEPLEFLREAQLVLRGEAHELRVGSLALELEQLLQAHAVGALR